MPIAITHNNREIAIVFFGCFSSNLNIYGLKMIKTHHGTINQAALSYRFGLYPEKLLNIVFISPGYTSGQMNEPNPMAKIKRTIQYFKYSLKTLCNCPPQILFNRLFLNDI